MTVDAAIPTWETVEDLLRQGAPALLPVAVQPVAYIEIGPHGESLALLLTPTEDVRLALNLAEVEISDAKRGGRIFVRIATRSPDLFRDFYALLRSIVVAVHDGGLSVSKAIAESVARWRNLVRATTGLSREDELGLTGELWLLKRLIAAEGPSSALTWTDDIHDFRRGSSEIEVKTTISEVRHHTINGLGQLHPSVGMDLWLLSIQLKQAPPDSHNALNIPDAVVWLRENLSGPALEQVERNLRDKWDYDDDKGALLASRYVLRTEPRIIPVPSDGLPRLTSEDISNLLGASFQRVETVRYTINVEGLGFESGTGDFEALIPADRK